MGKPWGPPRRETGQEIPLQFIAISFLLTEDDDVVHDGRIPWAALHAFDPSILRESGIDREVLVFNGAFGRHVVRLRRHRKNLVGRFRQPPAVDEARRQGQFLGIPLGSAGGGPLAKNLLLILGQTAVVAEMAELRIGMPGGHPPLADDFGNHVGPARDFGVARHREGTDFAGAVTRNAAVVQNPRDLVRVRHLGRRVGRVYATDEATNRGRFRFGDAMSGQQIVEGRLQLAIADRLADKSHAKLIVDAALIADRSLSVEHEDLGCSRCAETIGQLVVQILQHGKVDLARAGIGGQIGQTVLPIGVDPQKLHVPPGVLLLHFSHSPAVEPGQRTLRPQEGDDDDRFVGVFGKAVHFAVSISERETLELRQVGGRGGDAPGLSDHGDEQRRGDKSKTNRNAQHGNQVFR